MNIKDCSVLEVYAIVIKIVNDLSFKLVYIGVEILSNIKRDNGHSILFPYWDDSCLKEAVAYDAVLIEK